LNSTLASSDAWDDVGRIGDLSGTPNAATAAPRHGDAIIIDNFAIAGDNCVWEEYSAQPAEALRAPPFSLCELIKLSC
jgi:hypothetical protein